MQKKKLPTAKKEKVRNIERLTTVDIRGRGIIYSLYRETLSLHEKLPTLLAAEKLKRKVSQGGYMIITTGFPVRPTYVHETDGPIGAISLARGIDKISEVNPLIVAEEEALPIIKATAYAGGLSVVGVEQVADADHAIALLSFPKEKNLAKKKAKKIINKFKPILLMAVEKVAANEVGTYHNMGGNDISEYSAKIEHLLRKAEKDDIPTIGIGDGGNEVGMGKIKEVIRDEVPYGKQCRCGCGGGIAAEIETDILVASTVSNWGAHAIIATLSLLMEKDLLHQPYRETEMLMAASKEGSIDGVTGYANGWADGISTSTHASIIQILKEIVSLSIGKRT